MVGDAAFYSYFQPKLGHMVFRHIYGSDLVPRLPPLTTGRFFHIGKEYASSDAGWVYKRGYVKPIRTFAWSTAIGLVAFAKQHLIGIPLLGLIPTRVSWGDHSPLNYLRTSQLPARGSELI
jgi:hypothetical protein